MQKTLLILGALLIVAGLFWPMVSKLGLGRLPGDIVIRGGGFAFYFPIATMIVLSIVATALFRLFGK